MISVLFVCMGNICRSPIAHGIFQEEIKKRNWEELVYVESAGTSSWHQGQLPDRGSIRTCKEHGFDITYQKSQPVKQSDNLEFDYIIPMDSSNKSSLIHEFGHDTSKIFLMRDFDDTNKGADVPDPYGHRENAFEEVFQMIERSMNNFIQFLMKNHSELI